MQARKFSAFPKISNAAAKLSNEEQDMLYAAWWRYAAFGEVVTFENAYLQIIFEAFLEDLDNSVKSSNANSGGRKKTGGSETQETPRSETQETPRSASSETPSYINQTKPYQTNTNQDKKEINKENQLCTDVVSYLNEQAGTHYKESSDSTRKHIRARIREGYTLNDFKTVIDNRIQTWKNDPNMSQYLRPPTLFGTKFESYLNADSVKEVAKSEFARFR